MVFCLIHLILTRPKSTSIEEGCAKVKRQERIRQWGGMNGKENVAKRLLR